jgi:protein TonB
MAHLERLKRYPAGARARREEGTAYVRFSIDANGNVRSAQLARSSGHAELDAAVLALVRRASPVPAPPPGAPQDITAPVRFTIR